MKRHLFQAPIRRAAVVHKEFVMSTDFSGYSVDCLIGQIDDDGKVYVCEYRWGALRKHEKI